MDKKMAASTAVRRSVTIFTSSLSVSILADLPLWLWPSLHEGDARSLVLEPELRPATLLALVLGGRRGLGVDDGQVAADDRDLRVVHDGVQGAVGRWRDEQGELNPVAADPRCAVVIDEQHAALSAVEREVRFPESDRRAVPRDRKAGHRPSGEVDSCGHPH